MGAPSDTRRIITWLYVSLCSPWIINGSRLYLHSLYDCIFSFRLFDFDVHATDWRVSANVEQKGRGRHGSLRFRNCHDYLLYRENDCSIALPHRFSATPVSFRFPRFTRRIDRATWGYRNPFGHRVVPFLLHETLGRRITWLSAFIYAYRPIFPSSSVFLLILHYR